MTSLSFLLPFAHWDNDSSFVPHGSTITVAKFLSDDRLVLGLSCGKLLLVSSSTSADQSQSNKPHSKHHHHHHYPTLRPHARLSGHRSPILALAPLPARTESGTETLLLSLDSASRMSKWCLRDGRCLQSVPSTLAAPKGFKLVPRHAAVDPVIVVYGCSTEIAVLNAETLHKILLWTGSVDWPVPAVAAGGREILAWMPDGLVQGWVLRKPVGVGMGVGVCVEREHQRLFETERREEWGLVVGFERAAERDYVLVQRRGVRVYAADGAHSFVLRKSVEMQDEEGEVAGYEVFEKRGVVFVWTGSGNGCVIQRGGKGLWGVVGRFKHPDSVGEGEKAVVMAFSERGEGRWAVAAFSQSTPEKRAEAKSSQGGGGGLAVGIFSLKDGGSGSDIEWRDNKEVLFTPPPPLNQDGEEQQQCTCTAIFSNLLVFAHGPILHLHTLSTFLLSYASPTAQIRIPTSSRICLLKRVRIGDYSAPGRPSAGREYLVVGTTSGELFTVDTPALQPTRRLPISATPIASATLLPPTLGKRLRSTLFVSAADGTASIVDVERARIMATFPSHDYLHLTSVATKPAQNVVLLTYEDGARREWDLGEEEGGVLKPPPSSRGSGSVAGAGGGGGGGMYAADLADEGWHEVRVGAFEVDEVEDGEEENEGPVGMDAAVKACLRFCEEGLPAMVVDVKGVLDTLQASVEVARQRSRRSERVVVGNNPALVAARSLLTALVPGGAEQLLGWGRQDDYEWRATTVDGYFFRRKTPAVMGQVGAGKHVSLLAPGAFDESEQQQQGVWGVGGTVTGIVLLAALALVGGLLAAGGRREEEEVFETVVERAVENVQSRAGRAPALGVFAKYWMDRNLLVRKTARLLMKICMRRLTNEQRDDAVSYWSRFLPVLVPPELFSSKDVVRSVVILGKLTADYADKIEQSVKKNVALSVELLLGDRNPHFQDTAIELVGDGWAVFQSLFDPAEVIHILIRISSTVPDTRRQTLHTCILSIARTNSPLLGSGLANNIAHGTSSPPQSTTTTTTTTTTLSTATATTICVAAMRLVTAVVRNDALLLQDVMTLIVAAVVKILDPSSPLREKVLPAVTELVNSLVDAYPSVAFHRPTQRLALSAAPGAILVWDLKAACEMNVLQGHAGMATWLAFSGDGKYMLAVDVDGGCVLVWRFVSGLLSFIGGGDGAPGVLMPRRREDLREGRAAWAGVVAVEWTGERSVEVRAGTDAVVIANVEAGKEGWGIL